VDNGWHASFGASPPSFVVSSLVPFLARRGGWQSSDARCIARTPPLIRPRTAGEGDRALARWRGRTAMRIIRCSASGTAVAPSTALRAVPLPRFAGQDKVEVACARLKTRLEMLGDFGARCRYRRRGYGVVCVNENRASRCFGVSIRSAVTCSTFIAPRRVSRSSLMVQVMISAIGRSVIFAAMRGLRSAELQCCVYLRKN
jgi:hypothetical protein